MPLRNLQRFWGLLLTVKIRKHAKKAADMGVDGLILVCAGAGGHAGALSPFALLREIKNAFLARF